MFSSRQPDTLKGLIDELGPLAHVGTVAEAIEFGDVVLVVVPYTAMEQIGKDYGNALAKKALVIDVSNPIARRDGAEIVKWVDDQGERAWRRRNSCRAPISCALSMRSTMPSCRRTRIGRANLWEFRSPATTHMLLKLRRASSDSTRDQKRRHAFV
jgi:hypothetical protein